MVIFIKLQILLQISAIFFIFFSRGCSEGQTEAEAVPALVKVRRCTGCRVDDVISPFVGMMSFRRSCSDVIFV